MDSRHKITTKEMVLSVPFFAAFLWFVVLIMDTGSAQQNLQLSPGRFDALVTVLFVFIILYGALLFYIFRALRKEETIEHGYEAKVTKMNKRSEEVMHRSHKRSAKRK